MASTDEASNQVLDLNKEIEGVDWEDDGGGEEEAQIELAVVGKIHTSRNINANALVNTLKKVWNPKHGCEANVIGSKIFYFQFHHWKDKQHVMESQPWHFDHHVMILDDAKGHGEKDCEETAASRKFSEKLRVNTPWKATKNDIGYEEGDLSNAVRRLFITKQNQQIIDDNEKLEDRRVEEGATMNHKAVLNQAQENVAENSLECTMAEPSGEKETPKQDSISKRREQVVCLNDKGGLVSNDVVNEVQLLCVSDDTRVKGGTRSWKRIPREVGEGDKEESLRVERGKRGREEGEERNLKVFKEKEAVTEMLVARVFRSVNAKLQPPSPPRLPVIGNLHQIGELPHQAFASLSKRYSKIMLLHFGSKPIQVVSTPEAACEIMKTQDQIFCNRPELRIPSRLFYRCRDVGFAPSGKQWRRMKSLCITHLLCNKKVRSYRMMREEECFNRQRDKEIITIFSCEVERDYHCIENLLEIHMENENVVTMDDVKANTLDLFAAGNDTTRTLLEWTMSELLRHPKVTEDNLEKLTYLKAVIKESLRLHPPVPLLVYRQPMQDAKINGFDIGADTHVYINAWAIHRDPTYWDEPMEFRPERFLNSSSFSFKRQDDFRYIPFGGGRRICPGIHFAMVNAELMLANLVYEFDWKVSSDCEELDMTETVGIAVHKHDPLMLIATPYSSS
uniref:DUF4283 domain-containing protein n=1 Tax=Chenopodium quinoa TaxID=63459 RepID=A0A803KQA7_CHEQI